MWARSPHKRCRNLRTVGRRKGFAAPPSPAFNGAEVPMRKVIYVVSLLALWPFGGASTDVAVAGPNPPWAYPVAPQGLPPRDANKIVTVPGSDKKYNEVEVNNPYGPPDWFPNLHPPMPKV